MFALGLTLAGCSAPAPTASLPARKQPGFIRVFNVSNEPFTMTLNGTAFGNGLEPGGRTSFTRIPPKATKLTIETANKAKIEIKVAIEEGEGTTLCIFDPTKADGASIVYDEPYAAGGNESLLRALVVRLDEGYHVKLEPDDLTLYELKQDGAGLTRNVTPGKAYVVKATSGSGKTLSKEFQFEAGHSYTALVRKDGKETKLEIIDNNPPLNPRGRQGMSSSS